MTKAVFQSRPRNQTLLLIYNLYTNAFRGLMLLASRKQVINGLIKCGLIKGLKFYFILMLRLLF